jgi:hypothetical protein
MGLEPGTFQLQTVGYTAAPGPSFTYLEMLKHLIIWNGGTSHYERKHDKEGNAIDIISSLGENMKKMLLQQILADLC